MVPKPLLSDEGLFKRSEIEKSIQDLKQKILVSNQQLEKSAKENDELTNTINKARIEDLSSAKTNNTIDSNLEKKQDPIENKSNNVVIPEKIALSETNTDKNLVKSPEEPKESVIDPKDFQGKWTGEIINPYNKKSELLLEIKNMECFMYIDKNGEKIPFKLFNFEINGKSIQFKLMPSSESDYGIVFKGNLIQGILSGVAIDPNGEKGKWYAKRI